MKGPLPSKVREAERARALELARSYLKGLDPKANRRFAVDVRKLAEANPLMFRLMRAFMGVHANWSADVMADANAGDAIAIQAVRELAAEAVLRGEPVPERYRALAAGALAGAEIAVARGRVRADHRPRDMMLRSAVFRLIEHDDCRSAVALDAVVQAAAEVRVSIGVPALRAVVRSIPAEQIEKETGRFLLSEPPSIL